MGGIAGDLYETKPVLNADKANANETADKNASSNNGNGSAPATDSAGLGQQFRDHGEILEDEKMEDLNSARPSKGGLDWGRKNAVTCRESLLVALKRYLTDDQLVQNDIEYVFGYHGGERGLSRANSKGKVGGSFAGTGDDEGIAGDEGDAMNNRGNSRSPSRSPKLLLHAGNMATNNADSEDVNRNTFDDTKRFQNTFDDENFDEKFGGDSPFGLGNGTRKLLGHSFMNRNASTTSVLGDFLETGEGIANGSSIQSPKLTYKSISPLGNGENGENNAADGSPKFHFFPEEGVAADDSNANTANANDANSANHEPTLLQQRSQDSAPTEDGSPLNNNQTDAATPTKNKTAFMQAKGALSEERVEVSNAVSPVCVEERVASIEEKVASSPEKSSPEKSSPEKEKKAKKDKKDKKDKKEKKKSKWGDVKKKIKDGEVKVDKTDKEHIANKVDKTDKDNINNGTTTPKPAKTAGVNDSFMDLTVSPNGKSPIDAVADSPAFVGGENAEGTHNAEDVEAEEVNEDENAGENGEVQDNEENNGENAEHIDTDNTTVNTEQDVQESQIQVANQIQNPDEPLPLEASEETALPLDATQLTATREVIPREAETVTEGMHEMHAMDSDEGPSSESTACISCMPVEVQEGEIHDVQEVDDSQTNGNGNQNHGQIRQEYQHSAAAEKRSPIQITPQNLVSGQTLRATLVAMQDEATLLTDKMNAAQKQNANKPVAAPQSNVNGSNAINNNHFAAQLQSTPQRRSGSGSALFFQSGAKVNIPQLTLGNNVLDNTGTASKNSSSNNLLASARLSQTQNGAASNNVNQTAALRPPTLSTTIAALSPTPRLGGNGFGLAMGGNGMINGGNHNGNTTTGLEDVQVAVGGSTTSDTTANTATPAKQLGGFQVAGLAGTIRALGSTPLGKFQNTEDAKEEDTKKDAEANVDTTGDAANNDANDNQNAKTQSATSSPKLPVEATGEEVPTEEAGATTEGVVKSAEAGEVGGTEGEITEQVEESNSQTVESVTKKEKKEKKEKKSKTGRSRSGSASSAASLGSLNSFASDMCSGMFSARHGINAEKSTVNIQAAKESAKKEAAKRYNLNPGNMLLHSPSLLQVPSSPLVLHRPSTPLLGSMNEDTLSQSQSGTAGPGASGMGRSNLNLSIGGLSGTISGMISGNNSLAGPLSTAQKFRDVNAPSGRPPLLPGTLKGSSKGNNNTGTNTNTGNPNNSNTNSKNSANNKSNANSRTSSPRSPRSPKSNNPNSPKNMEKNNITEEIDLDPLSWSHEMLDHQPQPKKFSSKLDTNWQAFADSLNNFANGCVTLNSELISLKSSVQASMESIQLQLLNNAGDVGRLVHAGLNLFCCTGIKPREGKFFVKKTPAGSGKHGISGGGIPQAF